MAKPTATTRVPASPYQPSRRRSRRTPASALGQLSGTLRRPMTTSTTVSGTEMSSIGTGTNDPANSSGSPGSSHAITRMTGSRVSLANPASPTSGRPS